MKPIKVAVCGANGYAGLETLRLLRAHDGVEVKILTSESNRGSKAGDVFPELFDYEDYTYYSLQDKEIYKGIDAAFLCLPHEAAANAAYDFLQAGAKVVDLSAAYRIRDLAVFEKFYKFTHPHPELIPEAVFGLCELYETSIRKARLVANPGCYPTSAILPLAPLLKSGIADGRAVVIDSKSGFSGRGKKLDHDGLFTEMNENFYAYNVGKHRHSPEIAQELSAAAGKNVPALFVPQIMPIDRGILSAIYIDCEKDVKNDALDCIESFYNDKPFIKVYRDVLPKLKWVQRTNYCMIGAEYDPLTKKLVLISVIDNMVKGAAGQAVQNMNLMFGLDETKGLI